MGRLDQSFADVGLEWLEPAHRHHSDVGKSKALVQARRLRKINPMLEVTALHIAVEEVPLGLLRGAAIPGCLDSRSSGRRHVGPFGGPSWPRPSTGFTWATR